MSTLGEHLGSDPANPDPYGRGDRREGFSPQDLTSYTSSDEALFATLNQLVGQMSNLSDILRALDQKAVERDISAANWEAQSGADTLAFPGVAGGKIAVISFLLIFRVNATGSFQWKSGTGRNLGPISPAAVVDAGAVNSLTIPFVGSKDAPVLLGGIGESIFIRNDVGNNLYGHGIYTIIESGP